MGGLSDLLDFKLFEGKKIFDAIKKKPSRLLTGVDPGSTEVWNAVKGSDDDPLVDEWGGTTKKNMDAMDRAGINTKPGRAAEGLAHAIAALYTGKFAAGKLGLGGAASAAPNTNATNPALIESASGTSGYGASSAGPGGGGSFLSNLDWSRLGQNLQGIGDSGQQQQQQPIEQIDLSGIAAADAARERELDAIALSSKRAKTVGGNREQAMARGLANAHPIDANGVQVGAIQELAKRADALKKRVAALKKGK